MSVLKIFTWIYTGFLFQFMLCFFVFLLDFRDSAAGGSRTTQNTGAEVSWRSCCWVVFILTSVSFIRLLSCVLQTPDSCLPGPVEALKQMLFRLQAVEAKLQHQEGESPNSPRKPERLETEETPVNQVWELKKKKKTLKAPPQMFQTHDKCFRFMTLGLCFSGLMEKQTWTVWVVDCHYRGKNHQLNQCVHQDQRLGFYF